MSFVLNNYQQISLFDSLGFLSERKQKILDKSWAKPFSDHIFSNINEMLFAPLYSDKRNSRPNAPVNVIVGALILKEFNGLTDDEILEECEFDFRYQYALHTTSYENQPLSDRTFSRFRERVTAYELVTGKNLIHDCMVSLAENIREYMDIAPTVRRMDSMMIESDIRQMGRLELIYTCLANLVREIARDGQAGLIKGLDGYADPNNRNRVIYHDRSTPQNEKIQKAINDAVSLLPKCRDEYGQTDAYQLLRRAIDEQTKKDDNGGRIPKSKGDGMAPDILQNPSDPDATYRSKAGKSHKGYCANLIKQSDSIRISFHRHQCEGCPYQSQRNPNIKKKTASLLIPLKSRRRILESAELMDVETRTHISRIRNGVETVPSVLRNKYAVDKMPVRGKLKTKQFFGFKVAALNFSKLMRFTQGKLKCRSFEPA